MSKEILGAIGSVVGMSADDFNGVVGEEGQIDISQATELFKGKVLSLKELAINEGKTSASDESIRQGKKQVYEEVENFLKETTGQEFKYSEEGLKKAFEHIQKTNALTDDKVENSELFKTTVASMETSHATAIEALETKYATLFKEREIADMGRDLQSLILSKIKAENSGFVLDVFSEDQIKTHIKDTVSDLLPNTKKDEQGNFLYVDKDGKIVKNEMLVPVSYESMVFEAIKKRIPFQPGHQTKTGSYGKHDAQGKKGGSGDAKKIEYKVGDQTKTIDMPDIKDMDGLIGWIEKARMEGIPNDIIDQVDNYFEEKFKET